jgi:hypothetical protein
MNSSPENTQSRIVRREPDERGFYAWDEDSLAAQILDGTATASQDEEFPFDMTGLEAQEHRSDFQGIEIISCNRESLDDDRWAHMCKLGVVALSSDGTLVGYANAECHDIVPLYPSSRDFLEMLSNRDSGDEHIANVATWQKLYPWHTIQRLMIHRVCEVAPTARGRGLGKAMVSELRRRAVLLRKTKSTLAVTKPFPLNWKTLHPKTAEAQRDAREDASEEFLQARDRLHQFWKSCFPYMRTVINQDTNEPFLIGMIPETERAYLS